MADDSPQIDQAALEPYFIDECSLIPLHRWNHRDQHGRERGKSPRDDMWRVKKYSTDEIRRWAAKGGNVGVRLRATQLVIDYDPRNAPEGRDVLAELELEFGLDLSKTERVVTGSGGLHCYYKLQPGSPPIVNELVLFPGVEFKSEGRQVVAAGSIHPTGTIYRWDAGSVGLLSDVPTVPDELLQALARPLVTYDPNTDASVGNSEIARCLSQLDIGDFRSHDKWLEIMMACHAGSDGRAKEEFVSWSTADPMYSADADVIRSRWDSLKRAGVTVATLYYRVLEAGGSLPKQTIEEAFEPIERDPEGPYEPKFQRVRGGMPKNNVFNGLEAIKGLDLRPQLDQFRDEIVFRGDISSVQEFYPDAEPLWGDRMLNGVRRTFLERYLLELSSQNTRDSVRIFAQQRSFNSLREYLDPLKWDGEFRLESWLQKYAGVENTAYGRAVGRIMLLAAIGRAYDPGVDYHTMVILEGPQGCGKSTLLKTLGGAFVAKGLPHASEKDIVDAMRGRWLIEIEELAGLSKKDINEFKAFLSREEDRVRLSYRADTENFKRQCVFIGTTNDEQYLRDPTGNRRFLPVRVGAIDIPGLARVVDQLWAETKLEWRSNPTREALELPSALWPTAGSQQERRRVRDPWEDALQDFLETDVAKDCDRFPTSQLIQAVAGTSVSRSTQPDYARLSQVCQRVLGPLGFEQDQFRVPERKNAVRGWIRPKDWVAP